MAAFVCVFSIHHSLECIVCSEQLTIGNMQWAIFNMKCAEFSV